MDRENRRKFLRELEKKFGIKQPSDWGNITYKKLLDAGAGSILRKRNLFRLLKETFPGMSRCLGD